MFGFLYLKREECTICFQDRILKPFCNNHSFCHSCCKKWSDKSILCPSCREQCVNKSYLTFDYNLKNIEYDEFKAKYEGYFHSWHSYYCIKKKHKFEIYDNKANNLIKFRCVDCNIEQIFSKDL